MQEGKVVGKSACSGFGSLGEGAEMSVGTRYALIVSLSSMLGH